MTKQLIMVTEYLNELIEDDTMISNTFRLIDELKARLALAGVDDVVIEDDGWEYQSPVIKYHRIETDEEYEARLKKEEAKKAELLDLERRKEEKEWKEFLRLQKKFGEYNNE